MTALPNWQCETYAFGDAIVGLCLLKCGKYIELTIS